LTACPTINLPSKTLFFLKKYYLARIAAIVYRKFFPVNTNAEMDKEENVLEKAEKEKWI
jgi:hypothetical protein